MHFYALLFSQGWQIGLAWVASYSLVSQIVFGALFAGAGVIAELFLWPQDAEMSRRIARLIVGAIVGPIAVVGAMFLISLFYYAPSSVLQNSASQAAKAAHIETERNCQTQQAALSAKVSHLQEQIQSDPYSRKLAQVEDERDAAIEDEADANNFADRIAEAADNLKKAEQEFEETINRENDAWNNYLLFTTGIINLKPGVTEIDAVAQREQYEHRKSETALAKVKVHEKAEALQIIEVNR